MSKRPSRQRVAALNINHMATPAPAPPGRRQFVLAVTVWGCFTLTFTVLLLPVFPSGFRASVSAPACWWPA